ncbi:MAG TPA: hypothetical protein VGL91_05765 [Acidobacteriota bacterium]|jgi:hypothetical protein
MNHTKHFVRYATLLSVTLVFLFASAAFAGPPLICRPFDIGNAKSLPFQGPDWSSVPASYDASRLVADTMSLLQPDTPVIVRMETIRRATIYARENREIADALLHRLRARVIALKDKERRDPEALAAFFDLGYLVETYRQAAWISEHASKAYWSFKQADPKDLDGYALVTKAISRGGGPEMEFAAALITFDLGYVGRDKKHTAFEEHVQKALAGAKEGSLLAKNLETHFGSQIKTLRTKALAEKQ